MDINLLLYMSILKYDMLNFANPMRRKMEEEKRKTAIAEFERAVLSFSHFWLVIEIPTLLQYEN